VSEFSKILQLIRKQGAYHNPPSILIGEVTSLTPFKVKTGDLELDNEHLLVADQLLRPAVSGSPGTYDYTTIVQTLSVGDSVAILPTEDLQTFIVLCKVVKP
jgi:hypothetical protein